MYYISFIYLLGKLFIDALDRLLDKSGRNVARGDKICSRRTKQKRRDILLRGFSILAREGYRLPTPESFREKHMQIIAHRLEKENVSPAYLVNVISTFRIFSTWINKAGMVGNSKDYVLDPKSIRRSTIAKENRGWRANGVDFQEVVERVERYDRMFAIYLKLMAFFGLRIQEALCFRPLNDIEPDGSAIIVRGGTKGGRLRLIRVKNADQLATLKQALELAKSNRGSLLIRGQTLKQNYQAIQYKLRMFGITKSDLGVTVHGLRHDYAQQEYHDITGLATPIEGGSPSDISRDQHQYATLQVMERLGHSRADIGTAYYGSYGHALRPRKKVENKGDAVFNDPINSDPFDPKR